MEHIYYGENGEQKGPVTRAELHQLLISKTITLDTPIWNIALQQWVALRTQPVLLQGIKQTDQGDITGTSVGADDAGNVYMTPELAVAFKRIGYNDAMIERFFDEGGKVVRFKYTISVVILTFTRESELVLVQPGKSRVAAGLSYTVMTFFLGWWGFPWGFIYTPASLIENLTGGKDLTESYYERLRPQTTKQLGSQVRQLG
ncbi:MAG: DUF4339 domain-containing protein [Verrucomicrobiota bacterium]|nr:DUF4339 domain-containing protein [Verrucomicrobiota bacterium]